MPFDATREFAEILNTLTREMAELKAQTRELMNNRNQEQRVNFQDTFTCHYDTALPGSTPFPSSRGRGPDTQRPHIPQHLGSQQDPTESQGTGRTRMPNSTQPINPRDIGRIVRTWDLKFSGEKNQSIDIFLVKLQESRALAGLSEEELLNALSELFTESALIWFRNERETWTGYADFERAARRWFGTSRRYQQRLNSEIHNRFQGEDELTRNYIVNLVGLMRKVSPPMSVNQQLDMLHQNLHPKLQKQIRRCDFESIEELRDLATDVEQSLAFAKNYHSPPPPETSLYPEMAYRPQKPKAPQIANTAVITPNEGQNKGKDPLAQMMDKLGEILKAVQSNGQQTRNNGSQKQYPQRDQGRGRNNFHKQRSSQSPPKTNPESPKSQPQGPQSGTGAKKKHMPQFTKPLACRGCNRLGYSLYSCPDCNQGNEKAGDR